MSGLFPGMDPWLEDPHLWAGIHTSLTTYARDQLQPQLTPRYVAAIEERVYLSTAEEAIVPDVSIRRSHGPSSSSAAATLAPDQARVVQIVPDDVHEPYITILDLKNNQKVVTVIAFFSPADKKKGNGRKSYLKKQREVLHSDASLVEIDLLRRGRYSLAVPEREVTVSGPWDYTVCISKAWERPERFHLYQRKVRDRLPRAAIPLKSADGDVTLDVQSLVDRTYEAGAYAERLDYARPCYWRLRRDDRAWAAERIQAWHAGRGSEPARRGGIVK